MKIDTRIEKDQTWELFKEALLETNGLRSKLLNLVKEISNKFPDKESKEFVAVEMQLMCNQLLKHRGTLDVNLVKEANEVYYYDLSKIDHHQETYYANLMVSKEQFQIYVVDREMREEHAVSLKRDNENKWQVKRMNLRIPEDELEPVPVYKKRK